MAKIAFLFLTISNIAVEQVWQRFLEKHDGQYSIYIHAKDDLSPQSPFKKYVIPEKIPTTWSNTMKAEIALLRHALKDPDNEKMVMISGDTMPLQHFDYVYYKLLQHPFSTFFYSWNDHQDPNSKYYYPKRILPGIPAEKQYRHSQWFVVNRKHAQLMVDDSEIIDLISRNPNDNEHYAATLLAVKGVIHEVINQQFMLVKWQTHCEHAFSFNNLDDREQEQTVMEAISSGLLFGRKFTPEANKNGKLQRLIDTYAYKMPATFPTIIVSNQTTFSSSVLA